MTRCSALLEQCKTADQARRVADLSEAVRVYAKRVGASQEVVNRAAEYKIRAERRLGEILQKTEKAKGATAGPGPGRGKRGTRKEPRFKDAPKLEDVGISKKLGSRAQKLAAVPEKAFEDKLATWREKVKEENERVTVNLLKIGDKKQKHVRNRIDGNCHCAGLFGEGSSPTYSRAGVQGLGSRALSRKQKTKKEEECR